MTVDTIDLIIGSHDTPYTGFYCTLHGRQMDFSEFMLSNSCCTGIYATS